MAHVKWREERPRLSAWFGEQEKRASFIATTTPLGSGAK
jgi:hypothetical protein